MLVVARRVGRAVDRRERDAESVGIGLAEFGDVVGDPAAGHSGHAPMQFGEKFLDGGMRLGVCLSHHGARDSPLVHQGPRRFQPRATLAKADLRARPSFGQSCD